MAKKRFRLTVDERLMLHLCSFSVMEDDIEAPFSMTQQGIADAINVLRSAVPRSIKNLEKSGKVEERLSHVKNTSRRRKVYSLTLEGRIEANEMVDKLNEKKVTLQFVDGERKEIRIKDVNSELSKNFKMLEILNALSDDYVVSEKLLLNPVSPEPAPAPEPKPKEKPSQTVEMIKLAPSADAFQGRKEELNQIMDDLESDTTKIIILHGIAGIGKTTLAAKALEGLKGKRSLLWYHFHTWDTVRNVLSPLAEFLAELNRDDLLRYIQSNSDFNLNEVAGILNKDLEGSGVVLFFDDFHTINDEIKNLFVLLRETIEVVDGVKMVITSRYLVKFYDRREVLVKKVIREVPLEGLDMESSFNILRLRGVSEELFDNIYRSTKGHPLSLELVEGEIGSIDLENFSVYLEEEVQAHLTDEERAALSVISIFRYPVGKTTITKVDPKVSQGTVSGLISKSLIKLNSGGCDIHDVMRLFFLERVPPNKVTLYHSRAAEHYVGEIAVKKEDLRDLRANMAEIDIKLYQSIYDDIFQNALEAQFHFVRADEPAKALDYLMEFGQKLLSQGYAQNLQAIFNILDPSDIPRERQVQYFELLGDTYNRMGQWEKAFSTYDEGLQAAMGAKDLSCEAKLYLKMGLLKEKEGDLDESMELLDKALSIAENGGDVRIVADASGSLGWLHWKDGNFTGASEYLQKCMETALEHPDIPGQAKLHIENGINLSKSGDIERSIGEFDKCLDILKKNIELDLEDSLFTRLQDNYLKAIFSHYVQCNLLQ